MYDNVTLSSIFQYLAGVKSCSRHHFDPLMLRRYHRDICEAMVRTYGIIGIRTRVVYIRHPNYLQQRMRSSSIDTRDTFKSCAHIVPVICKNGLRPSVSSKTPTGHLRVYSTSCGHPLSSQPPLWCYYQRSNQYEIRTFCDSEPTNNQGFRLNTRRNALSISHQNLLRGFHLLYQCRCEVTVTGAQGVHLHVWW
jgi:hypothetical protein